MMNLGDGFLPTPQLVRTAYKMCGQQFGMGVCLFVLIHTDRRASILSDVSILVLHFLDGNFA